MKAAHEKILFNPHLLVKIACAAAFPTHRGPHLIVQAQKSSLPPLLLTCRPHTPFLLPWQYQTFPSMWSAQLPSRGYHLSTRHHTLTHATFRSSGSGYRRSLQECLATSYPEYLGHKSPLVTRAQATVRALIYLTRHDRFLPLDAIYSRKKKRSLSIADWRLQSNYPGKLSERLDLQDTWEDRSGWEVAVKLVLVCSYLLDADSSFTGFKFKDFVDKQKRKPMRKDFFDFFHVEERSRRAFSETRDCFCTTPTGKWRGLLGGRFQLSCGEVPPCT